MVLNDAVHAVTSFKRYVGDQSIEWRLHWLLRIGVFLEFVGHGTFGVKTKAAWLAYFHVFAVPDDLALRLMPVIGIIDITLGCLALVAPRRGILLYMTAWGAFTALLRPAAGQGWWEFFERSYNFGGPAALLALYGTPREWKDWMMRPRMVPALSVEQRRHLLWGLRLIVASMLIGHGGYGVFLVKNDLLVHYQSLGLGALGLPLETWRAGIGFFEIGMGAAALLTTAPEFFLFVCGWKLLTELLFVVAGANGAWWEVVERGGSYMVPLAAAAGLAYWIARARDTLERHRTAAALSAADSVPGSVGSHWAIPSLRLLSPIRAREPHA